MISYSELNEKVILVGLIYRNKNNKIIKRFQFFGKIVAVNKRRGIKIRMNNSNEIFTIPFDLSAIQKADRGIYKLHNTNEVVKNPDYVTTWTIYCDN